jgi:hypothetical protein
MRRLILQHWNECTWVSDMVDIIEDHTGESLTPQAVCRVVTELRAQGHALIRLPLNRQVGPQELARCRLLVEFLKYGHD